MTAQSAQSAQSAVLRITGLKIAYEGRRGTVNAVNGVDLEVAPGQIVAIVGESGSGKSTTAHAVLGLLPSSARVIAGSIDFQGRELAGVRDEQLLGLRGRHIGFVPPGARDLIGSLATSRRPGGGGVRGARHLPG